MNFREKDTMLYKKNNRERSLHLPAGSDMLQKEATCPTD